MYSVSVSFLNGISTFVCYLDVKAIFVEEQPWYFLSPNLEDKGVHSFPKGNRLKVKEIVWLEF